MTNEFRNAALLEELSVVLYDFLPGKPHPFAHQDLSFPGIAADLGIPNFWVGGSKRPAIRKILEQCLISGNGKFAPFVEQVVKRGMTRRATNQPVTFEEINKINNILYSLGYKIPALHNEEFLLRLPRSRQDQAASIDLTTINFQQLSVSFERILRIPDAQQRGYEFEIFLSEVFAEFSLAPRRSFRNNGQQIDGSFLLYGTTYLIEARWRNKPADIQDVLYLHSKVQGVAVGTRGLFISYAGFTEPARSTYPSGRSINSVFMDGLDIHNILSRRIDLVKVIDAKYRYAAETNRPYISIDSLDI